MPPPPPIADLASGGANAFMPTRSGAPIGVGFWRKFAGFAGPGFLVAVGYMDPGNWATGLAGGAAYCCLIAPRCSSSRQAWPF